MTWQTFFVLATCTLNAACVVWFLYRSGRHGDAARHYRAAARGYKLLTARAGECGACGACGAGLRRGTLVSSAGKFVGWFNACPKCSGELVGKDLFT
jgi:hypothetical protein